MGRLIQEHVRKLGVPYHDVLELGIMVDTLLRQEEDLPDNSEGAEIYDREMILAPLLIPAVSEEEARGYTRFIIQNIAKQPRLEQRPYRALEQIPMPVHTVLPGQGTNSRPASGRARPSRGRGPPV